MLETQATHSEMLREILQAAAVPGEPEQALTDMLSGLIETTNGQHAERNYPLPFFRAQILRNYPQF